MQSQVVTNNQVTLTLTFIMSLRNWPGKNHYFMTRKLFLGEEMLNIGRYHNSYKLGTSWGHLNSYCSVLKKLIISNFPIVIWECLTKKCQHINAPEDLFTSKRWSGRPHQPMKPLDSDTDGHKETANVKNIEHGHGIYILYINKIKQFILV
jgi:hypothetical protein